MGGGHSAEGPPAQPEYAGFSDRASFAGFSERGLVTADDDGEFRDSCDSAESLRELMASSLHISDREIWRTARRLKLNLADDAGLAAGLKGAARQLSERIDRDGRELVQALLLLPGGADQGTRAPL